MPALTDAAQTTRSADTTSANDATSDRWAWLAGTYWYVPTETLPALQVADLHTQRTRLINDQTLWFFERFDSGYLIGRAAISLDGGDFQPLTIVGSVTPPGDVMVTLAPTDTIDLSLRDGVTIATLSSGAGRLVQRNGDWAFLMQMNNGTSVGNVSHWSYMVQSTPDDQSWTNLPGVPGVSIGDVFAE